jgi:cytoskeleton protein RodZ
MAPEKHQAARDTGSAAGPHSPPADALTRLGSVLTEARIGCGLERSTLAAQLCMGQEQLEALETADRERLPESVFVIAQARRVAAHLGVDIAAVVDELKQASSAGDTRPRTAAATPPRNQRRAVGTVVVVVTGVIAAGVWGWPRLQRHTGQAASPPAQRQPPASRGGSVQPPAAARAPQSNALLLRTREPSWLEVRGSGGRVLYRGTLRGEQRFALDQTVRVLAGRPDLVTISIGGSAPRSLGRIEDIRWVVVTPPAAATSRAASPSPISSGPVAPAR